MKTFLIMLSVFSSIVCTLSCQAAGEESQSNRRYLNEVFSQTQRTANIIYGENINNTTGKMEQLSLRFFEPKNDLETKRPLFILTPGGGFVRHEDSWMDEFGEQLARAGYVVAINRYRLSDNIHSPEKFMDALFKAVADQKAAIQFFVKDAKGKNLYKIDPNNIFIGGHSAGAITSMHVAYLDITDSLVPTMKQGMENNGGMPGNTVNESVPYKIRGVVNLSGLLTDLHIIDAGEPALMSMHGDKDQVVSIDSTEAGTHGSLPIHKQADAVGLTSELHIIRGALHNDPSDPALCPECVPLTKRFMFEVMRQDTVDK
jgi:hypothetical protein